MNNFELNLNIIQNKANFELDCLSEYMAYFIESRYFIKTIQKLDIIEEPFEVGCKRWMQKYSGVKCEIQSNNVVENNQLIWNTEVIREETIIVKNFNILPFNQIMSYIYQYKLNLNQFKIVVLESIKKMKNI